MSKDLTDFNELLEDFRLLEDNNQRADLLIELAESYEEPPDSVASKPYPEELRVPGCESEVFMFTTAQDEDSAKFYFAVENPQGISAKAMAAFIDQTLSGVSRSLLNEVDETFVHELFGKQLSMGKGQGLTNMVLMAKAFKSS